MASKSSAAPPETFHVPLRIRRVAGSADPPGDPLLKARTHIGASGAAGLAIHTSLVGATYSAILKSLGPPAWCRQILKRPARLWNVHIPRVGRAQRVHRFRFGNTYLLPAWRFIFRRKPWFGLFPFGYFLFGYFLFGPLFRNHNAVVVTQDVAGLRRRRPRQRRRQNDQHDHRGFAHHCHRIRPPHVLASWPLIQCALGVPRSKNSHATRCRTQEQRRDIPRRSGMAGVRHCLQPRIGQAVRAR